MGQYRIDIFERHKGDGEPIPRQWHEIEAPDDAAAIAKATALYNEATTDFAKAENALFLTLYEGERLVHDHIGPV
jgi:hypothetical protein